MVKSKKRAQIMNMVYGIGASVVIIGALFKILHWEFTIPGLGWKLGGGTLLAVGLITEAVIFFISAFEPVQEEVDWSLVYPELKGGEARERGISALQGESVLKQTLSEKLDEIMKEANVNAELMQSLATSISKFEAAAKGIAPVTDAISSTTKYSKELTDAANHLEALNKVFRTQLEKTQAQMGIQNEVVDNLGNLNQQVASFKDNIRSLNGVYGGMLSAMKGDK